MDNKETIEKVCDIIVKYLNNTSNKEVIKTLAMLGEEIAALKENN